MELGVRFALVLGLLTLLCSGCHQSADDLARNGSFESNGIAESEDAVSEDAVSEGAISEGGVTGGGVTGGGVGEGGDGGFSERTYQFGVVPQFGPEHLARVWLPLVDRLKAVTGLQVELVATPSIPDFESGFSRGDFDFAYMNPYHFVRAKASQGYRPLVRDHKSQLKGILVVAADSGIKEVEDLQNAVIDFPSPNALGASLFMRALLTREYDLQFSAQYVKSHDSVYLNVLTGAASAGGGVQATLDSQERGVKDGLRVIYETPGVAPHPIAYHPRVPKEVAEKVRDAFFNMAKSSDGQALLEEVPMPEPGEATDEDYQPLIDLRLEDFYVSPKSDEQNG